MTAMNPITYECSDFEPYDAPGVFLSDVKLVISIYGIGDDYHGWGIDKVRVGWAHLNRWKDYEKGDFLYEVVARHAMKHLDDEITRRCIEAAKEG